MSGLPKMEPVKWRKHLKLVEYGLREYQNLVSEIHRYSISETAALHRDIKQELLNDSHKGEQAFYIIKMVNNNQYYKLPNYRIYSTNDLDQFLLYIESQKYLYHELWYCRTQYDDKNEKMSVAGRLLFNYGNVGSMHIIEQVWNRSPRMIEEYNNSVDFVFLRASRPSWGHRYTVDHLHIPKALAVDPKAIQAQFSMSVVEIERNREKLEIFEEYLSGFNFNVFNIEYKIMNGRLYFIDWDTPNDGLVIK